MSRESDYVLYPRVVRGKNTIWYYYNESGRRVRRSTGRDNRKDAIAVVNSRIRRGKLQITYEKFVDFARDWWTAEHPYTVRRQLSELHCEIQAGFLRNHLMPYFGRLKLEKITPVVLQQFITSMLKGGKSPSLINHCKQTLSAMLSEAERMELIYSNPCRKIERLRENTRPKGILTVDEARDLFSGLGRWRDNLAQYSINLTAASTGMRLSELRAIRGIQVHEGWIGVTGAYSRNYGLKSTKTGKPREVRIPERTQEYLSKLQEIHRSGFLFSVDGTKPLAPVSIGRFFNLTLERNGIDRKARNITFHSWRHFFNSLLRARGIPDAKVKSLTGHATDQMMDHYTQFDRTAYVDVLEVQEEL